MTTLLLFIIYLAFISLGLPDALLGSAWPVMQKELQVSTSYAGIITMIISGGTILSSLFSDCLTKKFGTGLVTAGSVLLTALALFGFSISESFWLLCLFAIPYGIGAGAVDASINNYAAVHYSSRHMNWLHCMWGIGAAISPYIMSYYLTGRIGWAGGYQAVALIQICLTLVLFVTLPLWKKAGAPSQSLEENMEATHSSLKDIFQIKGVPFILLAFFGYCASESTIILWASSYLVSCRKVDIITAAKFGALFLIGITIGRFLSGFISEKLGDRKMIRLGCSLFLAGIILVILPFSSGIFAFAGLILSGLGCAPIYPAIIHSTPANFGTEQSQAIVGIQMASAYVGSTFVPPLFGVLASNHMELFPYFLLVFACLIIVMTEKLNKTIKL